MKKIVALLLTFCLLLGLTACGEKEKPVLVDGKATFTVIVVHSDGTEKTFTYTTEEEYVGPVLVKEGLLEGNDGLYGLEITKVDGEKAVYNEDKAYWAVFEEDKYANQGIDTTPVIDGRTYKLVYTGA